MPGTWTEDSVGGKSVDIFQPTNLDRPRFGLIFLHGIGSEYIRGNEIYSGLLDKFQIPCLGPRGQRCWWTDRVCQEFDPSLTPERHILDHVLPFFQQRWNLAPRAIGLFGISMGGQGALRLAFKHSTLFPVVAGISSALDYHELYGQGGPLEEMYDSREQCRQDTALLHVPPHHYPPHIYFCIDPGDEDWFRGNDRLHEKLNALGIQHTADLTTQAGGHSWQYFNHMAEPVLRFLLAGLEQESRRLM
jgi:pimeloyl-ACP methyl ester carboxylesterase